LDHNATTPIAPEVLEAMMPYLTSEWGNPSSSYKFGSKLKGVVEVARKQVAELIGARSGEIVFTSCATESNNAAIHAALKVTGKRHIVTSAVEHSSVLNCVGHYAAASRKASALLGFSPPLAGTDRRAVRSGCHSELVEESLSYRVTYLPVDRDGLLKLADLENAITDDTAIVSLMWANNETGVLFPVKEIAEICRARGVLFHCDAVQAAGKVEIDVRKVPVDYLSLTGHKIGAPKGIGTLFVRRKTPFVPLIHGGHQEANRRGGTESVPLIVGLGKAAALARNHLPDYDKKVRPLRDALEKGILSSISNTELNGHKTHRLANTTNITFHGIESEALLILLDQEGVCASSGSACLADSDEPSHVVKAMKPDSVASRQMVRLSLGDFSNDAEVRATLTALRRSCKALRS
jgi:cysteine desulfurase